MSLDLFAMDDARRRLFEEAATPQGGICPCCDRFTKIYPRKFHTGMAEGLIWLFTETVRGRVDTDGYIMVGEKAPRNILRSSGSVSSCAYWGLVEQMPNDGTDSTKHYSGMWRITEKGVRFVRAEIKIESHVKTYNQQVVGMIADEMITLATALGRPFDYRELMNA